MSYTRDTSEDLVWNSSTNSYEPASTPATSGYLTDGNGNLLMFNGEAVYVETDTPSDTTIKVYLYIDNPGYNQIYDFDMYNGSMYNGNYHLTTKVPTNSMLLITAFDSSVTFDGTNNATIEISSPTGSSNLHTFTKLYISNDGETWGNAYTTYTEASASDTWLLGPTGGLSTYTFNQTTYFKLSNT